MKKHYITMAIVTDVLVLALFVLGTGFYTCISAMDIIKPYWDRVNTVAAWNNLSPDHNTTEQELIINSYYAWNFHNDFRLDGMGLYSCIGLADGTTLDSSSDFCLAWKSEDSFMEPDEVRIFAIPQGFEDPYNIYDPVFEGECDDVYIHGGTMVYQEKTYQLDDFDYSLGERVSAEEWADGQYLYCYVCRLAKDDYGRKLNQEAEAIYNEFLDSINSSVLIMPAEKQDIWTSYKISCCVTPAGNMYTVQVFHPVELVLRSNIALYIVLLVVMLAALILIPLFIARLYRSRKEYEMRSRRLTRGVAHELKTPLAVTKAYMDNWDMLSEEDRTKYAQMVGREIDDMSDLITTLLEMDKIDSGKIKLNLEEVEISSLISSVYKRVKPLADERKLEVKIDTDKEYVIKADLKLMKIAISNYLTNMVKYADKEAKVDIWMNNGKVLVQFKNDSTNDRKSNTDKLSSNGMGVEINENIMKLHGFKSGSNLREYETVYWFEAEKV